MSIYNEVSSLGGIKIIDSFEYEVAQGNVYGAFIESVDYESDQTFGMFFETLDNSLVLNLRGQVICGTDSQLIMYEGLTVNPGAVPTSEFAAVNLNRLYPNATANIQSIAASPIAGYVSTTTTAETSPVATPGTVIVLIPFGGDRTRFDTNILSNIILAPSTIYGIEFTPGGAGGTAELAALQLIWSESTLQTDDELEGSSFFEDVRRRILKVNEIVQ